MPTWQLLTNARNDHLLYVRHNPTNQAGTG
jgi:hypothetical protein